MPPSQRFKCVGPPTPADPLSVVAAALAGLGDQLRVVVVGAAQDLRLDDLAQGRRRQLLGHLQRCEHRGEEARVVGGYDAPLDLANRLRRNAQATRLLRRLRRLRRRRPLSQ